MKIYIEKPFLSGTDAVKIWVLDERNGSRNAITLDRETKHLKSTRLDPDKPQPVETFLELPYEFFNDFVKAIVTYASENDIKTENDHLLQGKLIATEKHL
jgi:hypothetical protein